MSKSEKRRTLYQTILSEEENLLNVGSSSSPNLKTSSGLSSSRDDLTELFRRIESLTSELYLLSQSENLILPEFSFVIVNYRSFLNSLESAFKDQGDDGVAVTLLRTQMKILAKLGRNLPSFWN